MFAGGLPTTATSSGGSGTLNQSAIPAAYAAYVVDAGTRCAGISAPLLAAQIEAESGWDPSAGSPAGAQGIAQFMPATWATRGKDYSGDGVANIQDPADAIGSQGDMMCALLAKVTADLAAGTVTGDPLQLALAAYNAGPGAVEAAGGIPPFPETQAYVERIMAAIPKFSQAPAAGDTGSGPPVTADGTARVAMSGSGHLDPSALCHIAWAAPQFLLRCDAEQALEKLNVAYRAQFGSDLIISSAYRDYAGQVTIKATKGGLAAEPGTSNHGWGLAVDLGLDANALAWMQANARTYGWEHPSWARPGGSKPEPWHWEFVGP
jgi:hypothetical protein